MRYFLILSLCFAALASCTRQPGRDVVTARPAIGSAPATVATPIENTDEIRPGALNREADMSSRPTTADRVDVSRVDDSALPVPPEALRAEDRRVRDEMTKVKDSDTVPEPTRTMTIAPGVIITTPVVPSSANQPNQVFAATAKPVFSVRKSPCYGDCEQYKLEVMEGGQLKLDGKKNTRLVGKHVYQPLSYQYAELVEAFREFIATEPAVVYPTEYEAPADAQATILEYVDEAGELRTISVYADAPEEFQQLLDLVESMVENGQWEK
ncbi:DUF6438 domain-containing protein [Neolewinella antarctica]|uniref:DUF6438 domain-containing protein n=1 Tax=Neolewinella antarctica TaxID=442734 RepID=A0ABX0X8J1_9BACT|nr:DUF6438 domain-containing protein [Neolewinella antarctica]NJC25142.1 hypothetical protein [Neolewinella antarctica]